MIHKLKNIYRQLNRSIFVGERLQSNINALSYVGLAIAFCTLITTAMNVMPHILKNKNVVEKAANEVNK